MSDDVTNVPLPDGIEGEVVDTTIEPNDDASNDVFQQALEDKASAEARENDEEGPGFQNELSDLLNRYSAESVSGTPDFILADYLTGVLKVYNEAVSRRAQWRGEFTDFNPSREVSYHDHFTGEKIKSPGDIQQEKIKRGEDLPRI